jgi:hypothetical protein
VSAVRPRRFALASLHLVLPALVLLAGAWFARCRTPIAYWADPDYAYLLNALSIAELAAPTHTQHPGTTAQELGAVILRSAHALRPAGFPTLREHVLASPEPLLRLWRSLALGLYAAALTASGLFVWRATGSLVASGLFQLIPLLSVETLFSLSRVQAEPLALALGAGATATIVALAVDPGRWDTRRTAAVLGVLAGLGVATKLTFAPVLLMCLVVLSRPSRRVFGKSAAVSAAIALLPTVPTLRDNARWYWSLLVHTGYYGAGQGGFVDLQAFPGNLQRLAWEEWAASLLGLMGLAVGLGLRRRSPGADPSHRAAARALVAGGVVQIAWLLVVGKHARARYLLPVVLLSAVSAVLIWQVCRRPGIAPAALRAGVIALALLAAAGQPWRLAAQAAEIRQETELRRQAAAIVASGAGTIIEATPVVSQAGALRYGQFFAPARFGADLRRLYPGVTAWDVTGINAFGAPADPSRVMTPLPDGGASFRMMGVEAYPVVDSPPAGVILKRVRSLGRHALYEGRVLPCAGASAAPFAGFFDSSGLQWTATPEPLFLGASPTRLLFTGNGRPMTLLLQVRPRGDRMRRLRISVNGRPLARPFIADAASFQEVSVGFAPRPGVNEALIEYGPADGSEPRVPVLAFRRLQLRCGSGG